MSRMLGMIYCNHCGEKICSENQRDKVSFVTVRKEWGYFSEEKDGEVHSMDFCEACYDDFVKELAIAPQIEYITEFV